ncbi:beta-propeller domain-containing protein [Nocardioides sp. R-C-SC26]|uniref:beta-propeller domain-containing protein n=1 Tax=Nocardioides sp. R-C-SC26 TaxID=2870414 RepID=UPI001E463C50|nr:beta-propeller domain-containing protein [Nocardioides sp. R-C-SC26]
MTDLERHWDDVPVGPAPVQAILREGRRSAATSSRGDRRRRARRGFVGAGVLAGLGGAFVAGTLVSQPAGVSGAGLGAGAGGTGSGPGAPAFVPAAFHGALQEPASCEDLLDHYRDAAVDLVGAWGWQYGFGYARDALGNAVAVAGAGVPRNLRAPMTEASADSAFRTSAKTTTATTSETGTNVQEAGVDEPDAVKTDGELLVRLRGTELTTYDVSGDDVERLGSLDLGDFRDGELLLTGTTVVAIGNDGSRSDRRVWWQQIAPQTRVLRIDVSDPTAPSIDQTLDVDAASVTARQHGSDVRLVLRSGLPEFDFVRPGRGNGGQRTATEANRRLIAESTLADWLPTLSIDDGAPEQLVSCDQVAIPRADLGLGTMTVVGFDAASPVDDVAGLASLGVAADAPLAYESTDRLYLAASPPPTGMCWDLCTPTIGGFRGTSSGTTTFYEFGLDGPAASYVGAGEVEGTVRDRWSMDEADGVLRVAVGPSSETGNFNSVVTLRSEGDELVEIGRLDGLGRNEDIQSVRWFDGLALLVTFRRIDPFYAVDLTDVENPTLLGELKIPGFSSYLHPLGGERVLGLGEGPQRTPSGRRSWGGQVGLFDVTDLTDPQRIDVHGYGPGSRTLAGGDPRQFTWLPEQRLALTVVARGRAGYVSAMKIWGGELRTNMTRVEFGSDVDLVRTVPIATDDGLKVALVTGEDVEFFELP